jgi:hypothetical protein
LPARFRAPEDAEAQLQRAVEYHHRTFGRTPAGLWPSEGSVCPELLPIAHRTGFRWLATDESILARSLDLSGRPWHRHNDLYQPYLAGEPGQDLVMLFRDRDISDAFGFIYHKTTPESASDDALRRLRSIIHDAADDRLVITIILDGENPWEHYHDGGEQFLSRLYTAFTNHELDQGSGITVQASTVSDAIAAVPPSQRLAHLHSGSWINADYKIWIGHQEDNCAWELLGHTRTRLVEQAAHLPPDRVQRAWDELYAAEGSDWFWWYGDDFETDFKPEFDRLFRTHLRNVWTHMGLTPPDRLTRPVRAVEPQLESDRVTQPHSLLSPTIDGLATDFFEWRGAGTIKTRAPLGAMWKEDGIFTTIQFGWSREQLYLRLDPDQASHARQPNMNVDVTLQGPQETFRLAFSLAPDGPRQFTLFQAVGPESWQELGSYRSIARRFILELGLPWKDLHLETGQEVRLSIVVHEHGLEVARYPHQGPAVLTVPGPEFEAALWRV